MLKLILLCFHFLPSLDQCFAQHFGYWTGLIFRSLSHFGVPLAWEKSPKSAYLEPFRVKKPKQTIIWSISGAVVSFSTICFVYWLLRPHLDSEQIREGVNEYYEVTLPMYLAVGFVISFVNPLMEEFFWRGFLYRKYRDHGGGIWVGILFAVHHWIIFRSWFEALPLVIALLGLALVGVLFNWLYHKTDNLWACLSTHCAADIAIIVIGYFILF